MNVLQMYSANVQALQNSAKHAATKIQGLPMQGNGGILNSAQLAALQAVASQALLRNAATPFCTFLHYFLLLLFSIY